MASGKKEIYLLLIAGASAIFLFASGFWLLEQLTTRTSLTPSTPISSKQDDDEQKPKTSSTIFSIKDRISRGDKILLKTEGGTSEKPDFQAAKQRGTEAMAASQYSQAVSEFEEALQKNPNAPETLIYRNNASIGTNKSYSIAVVVPAISDPDTALATLRGVAQAQNAVNQIGGINGVPLKIAIANDDDDPKFSTALALEFARNPEILGVIGYDTSASSLESVKIHDAEKLVAISSTSTSVKLSGSSPYFFRTVPSDAFAARALAKHLTTKLNRKNAAVFYKRQDAYSESLKSAFVQEIYERSGRIVDEFDLSEPGFSAFDRVKQAIDKGAEALLLAPSPDTLDKALDVVQVNKNRLSLVGGDVVYAPKTLEAGAEAAGMVLAVSWDIDANPNSAFVVQSKQIWKGDVNWLTAMAYDAAQAFIEALKRNPNPTRLSVQQALSAPDFSAPGASGTIRFVSASGDRYESVQLVEIKPNKNSRTGYDFVPIE